MRSSDLAAELGLGADDAETMLAKRNADYRKILENHILIPVREGIRQTLSALKGQARLAMVTGSPRDQLEMIHRGTDLLDYFEFIVSGDDCSHQKPHPESYLTALSKLDLPAECCLAVEDSPRGVKAALAAGLRCVLMPHELTDLSLCDGVPRITDARELLPLVVERSQV